MAQPQPLPDNVTALKPDTTQFLTPHSIEAEEALLGGLIINPAAIDTIHAFLKADDFFILRNSWVYEAILKVHSRGEVPDNITINQELKAMSRADETGGAAYLTYLINNATSSLYCEVYAHVVERAATRRRLIEAAGDIAKLANAEDKDISEVIDGSETALAKATERRSTHRILSHQQVLDEVLIDLYSDDNDSMTGVTSGYEKMDGLFGGFQKGELIVIAGRSKGGKSTFLLNLANGAAKAGHTVGYFSLEMLQKPLMRRLLGINSGVNTQRIRLKKMDGGERHLVAEASRKIRDYKIHYDMTPRLSVLELRSKARMLQQKHGIDIAFVDYLQLMKPTIELQNSNNRERQVASIAEALKELARELNIPVVVAAQLNREAVKSSDKRPRIEHLRESDAIQHNADVIALFHCLQLVDPDAPKNGSASLYIDKHRDGPEAELNFQFDLHSQKISEAVIKSISLGV